MATVKLDDVACEVRESWKADRAGVPVVGLEHLEPDEIWLRHWDVNPDENTFSKGFKMGQLLFGRRRAYQKKMSIAPCDGICSGDITVIAAKPEKILPELLPFYLRTDAFFDFAMRGSGGSLSPRVKWSHIAGYEFDLPPLDEQRKLADLLWAANELKEKYKKAIAATDEMLKAKFREMFGECGVQSAESGVRLEDVVDVMDDKREPLNDAVRSTMKEGYLYPYYGANGVVDYINKYLTDDTLLCIAEDCGAYGPGEDSAYIIRGKSWVNNHAHLVKPKEGCCLIEFLQVQFRIADLRSYISGTTRQKLTQSKLRSIMCVCPPLALQQQFVEIARKADETKAALKKSINDVEQVIKGLING